MLSQNRKAIDWKIIVSASIFICELVFFGLFLIQADYTPNSRIKILNPSFHPVRGGNWTVFFETKNTSTLSIRLADIPTVNDMEFSYIACKGDKRAAEVKKDRIIVKNWFCDGQGAIIFKVKKLGNHELAFNFGKQLALAHNSSQTVYDLSASSSVTRFAYQGQDYATSVPVRVDRSVWSVASSTQFTTAQYTAANSSNDTYAETSATSNWNMISFPQIVHDFEFRINEATATVTQIDYSWEGRATQGQEKAAYNDLRLYVYDKTGNAFRLGDSKTDNSCNGADCTMTYTTTTDISKFFDADKDIRFIVQKYEMGHNCSSSPTNLTCAYQATGTDLVGGEVALGCAPQIGTDYWNQCTATPNTCYTGNCFTADIGQTPYTCGFYVDGAQHSCPTCYGCSASSPTSACTAMSAAAGAASQDLGCGDGDGCDICSPAGTCGFVGQGNSCSGGPCYTCNGSGGCDTSFCEGQQCGCTPGQTCQSGVCASPPSVCQLCCQGNGYPNGTCVFPGQCSGPPYFGDSMICGGNCSTPPTTECCCYN